MKFESFSDKSYLILSQSPHGSYQDGKAIDFAHLSGNAPAKGKVNYFKPQGNTRQNYFGFGQDGWELQAVHSNPMKSVGSIIEKGQAMWRTTWHHLHLTLKFNGKWYYVLSALDWNKVKVYWLKYGQSHPVWTKQSTYGSLELPPYLSKTEMVNLQQAIQCQSTNTIDMNIRKEPSTGAGVIGKMKPNTRFSTKQVAKGSNVQGVDTWYKYSSGWVSGKYVRELPQTADCSAVEKQLSEANKKIESLNSEKSKLVESNQQLTTLNNQYKPGYEAAKLINSVK